jgi:hypothetical protein
MFFCFCGTPCGDRPDRKKKRKLTDRISDAIRREWRRVSTSGALPIADCQSRTAGLVK